MSFDELLDNLYGFDCEVFAHDTLFVFILYRTKERFVFHNSLPNDVQNFLDQKKPILMGYNCNAYDKYILKCLLAGYTPEEIKDVNDYIIGGGNGWDIDCGYMELPIMWDLFNEIVPRKSLKELEGNLKLNITETTVPFDLPTKWNKQQYEEVLYYCTCDVEALFPIFEMLINKYKSKYIIARLGKMDLKYGMSLTDAKLTSVLLGAKRKNHDDPFKYVYPKQVDKSKIPKSFLNYIDDFIKHNDLNYESIAPSLQYDECVIQLGHGGIHGAKLTTYKYDNGCDFKCD